MSSREDKESFVLNLYGTSALEIIMLANLFWISMLLTSAVGRFTAFRDAGWFRVVANWASLFVPLLMGITLMASSSSVDVDRDGVRLFVTNHTGVLLWWALLAVLGVGALAIDDEPRPADELNARRYRLFADAFCLWPMCLAMGTAWPDGRALLAALAIMPLSPGWPYVSKLLERDASRREIWTITSFYWCILLFSWWWFGLAGWLAPSTWLGQAVLLLGALELQCSCMALVTHGFVKNSAPEVISEEDAFHVQYDEHQRLRFLTFYRAGTAVSMALCILAVDFPVFPRRLAKTFAYGVSLMDLGVGSVILSSALFTSSGVKKKSEVTDDDGDDSAPRRGRISSSLRSALILAALGVMRTVAVRAINYQAPVDEYGRHWNFFMTLACVSFLHGAAPWSQWLTRLVYPSAQTRTKSDRFGGIFITMVAGSRDFLERPVSCTALRYQAQEDLPSDGCSRGCRRTLYTNVADLRRSACRLCEVSPWLARIELDRVRMREQVDEWHAEHADCSSTHCYGRRHFEEQQKAEQRQRLENDNAHTDDFSLSLLKPWSWWRWGTRCPTCSQGHCKALVVEQRFVALEQDEMLVGTLPGWSRDAIKTLPIAVVPIRWYSPGGVARSLWNRLVRPHFRLCALFLLMAVHQFLLSHPFVAAATGLGGGTGVGDQPTGSLAGTVLSWTDESRLAAEERAFATGGWLAYMAVANIEGLLSLPGYVALWAAGCMFRPDWDDEWWRAKYISRLVMGMITLVWLWSSGLSVFAETWLGCHGEGWAVSRRLANPAYVLAVLALNLFVLTTLASTSDILSSFVANISLTSELVEAISEHQLVFFLLANVLTGLVNALLDTIRMVNGLKSVTVLVLYSIILSYAIIIYHRWRKKKVKSD